MDPRYEVHNHVCAYQICCIHQCNWQCSQTKGLYRDMCCSLVMLWLPTFPATSVCSHSATWTSSLYMYVSNLQCTTTLWQWQVPVIFATHRLADMSYMFDLLYVISGLCSGFPSSRKSPNSMTPIIQIQSKSAHNGIWKDSTQSVPNIPTPLLLKFGVQAITASISMLSTLNVKVRSCCPPCFKSS